MNSEEMKSLAVPEINSECQARIEALTPDTAPLWGKMSAAQMMAHCAEILEVAGGKEMRGTPRLLGAMDAFGKVCSGKEALNHPFFGDMTVDEVGRAMYKHLDHHLGQFGV